MDIKLKSKPLYSLILIMGIYILGIAFLTGYDFMEYKNYLSEDAYFHTYQFQNELMIYYQNVAEIIRIQNYMDLGKNVTDETAVNNVKSVNSLKYYIKDKKSGKIFTNIDSGVNIQDYIKNKAVYTENFPESSASDMELQPINSWFVSNNFEGEFIFLKDVDAYSQLQKDYRYYSSIRARIIKEGIICALSCVLGTAILLYFLLKKRYSTEFFYNLYRKFKSIPLDLKVFILIAYLIFIRVYVSRLSFFYRPIVNLDHLFKLSVISISVVIILFYLIDFFDLLRNKDELALQWKGSLINSVNVLLKENKSTRKMILQIGIIFIFTLFAGALALIWLMAFDNREINLLYTISIYLFCYVLFVPYLVLKKLLSFKNILIGTDKIAGGDLSFTIETPEKGNFSNLAKNINNMKEGFRKSVESQIKSERLKSELITNVSHDLKTPLTSIINYVDLLKKEDLSKEELSGYIQVLDKKSQRLKTLIEDLFEASKMASGTVELELERVDIAALLRQTMGEFNDKIQSSDLNFKVNIPSEKIYARLDGKKTWRVFENLIGNILKYSQPSTRVYIDLKKENNRVITIMKNISSYELDFDVQEIFERFKRGDKSRNTEGSGLGLAIAKSIVELEGGNINIETDGDLFKVSVEFDCLN